MKSSVLVIDDNPHNLKLARVLIQTLGYDVCSVVDAESALEALQAHRPDLILMDLQLPGMDGFQLTQKLKADAAFEAIPIVAVTAYAMRGDQERALAAGCDGYLPKPIDADALAAMLAHHLDAVARR